MAYRTLLFDIDDTLLNFQAAEKQALESLFKKLKLPLTSQTYDFYHDENLALWQQFELGKISKSKLLVKRFTTLFDHLGISGIDGQKMEELYRDYLGEGHQPMPQAPEVLSDLCQSHDLYVVTNGVAKTQQRRLSEAHFDHYFKDVFISELVGAQKPAPEFFQRVTADIQPYEPTQTLVIGDSLTSDIKGAASFGLDSVWYNPNHAANQTKIKPTYEIDQLDALETIVA
ncbi:noncanonical pyrimidine nucleotidase, YjjG family [Lactobacillus sp. LC28-10]|uniref:Noncanonical pyrimidine nucleotidase, YjjG family n=1 Tax=Secundilactobacillus angelensis TaxID=2722706 RepID=A0ABX1KW81_9LACO|nr:YjjG family noncanonical pyrimidine nucleotidase [Secundilactobacillus angelensis]MCH5462351.1 YjjG family noncanonical pyrimidine nucleotidase [Secundilactobacillus angelensis]NLR18167.1 noncanonical pyrimidine nucleotidase, YjjG family [Secundilactobacillus angelensis]